MPKTEQKYGFSTDAVRAKTGKTWDEWLELLDAEHAKKMPHKEIARLLSAKYHVPDWWSQMVTVGYERARGLRAVHQKANGYSANASKTFHASLGKLYAACADEATRAKWLGKRKYSVSRATPNKSLRIAWGKDGATRVALNLYAKGKTKSMIQVQHDKLESAGEVEQMKTYWKLALEKLDRLLE